MHPKLAVILATSPEGNSKTAETKSFLWNRLPRVHIRLPVAVTQLGVSRKPQDQVQQMNSPPCHDGVTFVF